MGNSVRRFRSWTLAHQRWFALGAVFSLFSVLAPITGEAAWLGNLGFLGFLGFLSAPKPEQSPNPAA